jgi:hypothetical protein
MGIGPTIGGTSRQYLPVQWEPLVLARACAPPTPQADLCSLATDAWVACDFGVPGGDRALDSTVRLCERCPAADWVTPRRSLVLSLMSKANAGSPSGLRFKDMELLRYGLEGSTFHPLRTQLHCRLPAIASLSVVESLSLGWLRS